jgi:hypothetical protein
MKYQCAGATTKDSVIDIEWEQMEGCNRSRPNIVTGAEPAEEGLLHCTTLPLDR